MARDRWREDTRRLAGTRWANDKQMVFAAAEDRVPVLTAQIDRVMILLEFGCKLEDRW